jgi:hypothetical protein
MQGVPTLDGVWRYLPQLVHHPMKVSLPYHISYQAVYSIARLQVHVLLFVHVHVGRTSNMDGTVIVEDLSLSVTKSMPPSE